MTKYILLHDYLASLKKDRWKAEFKDIEKIIGFALPRSARRYPAWWANQEYSSQCSSWLQAGWRTGDLDLAKGSVVFLKDDSLSIKTKRKVSLKAENEHINFSKLHSWDMKQEIKCSVEMQWEPAGIVLLDKNSRLVFPKAEQMPAIYRFRIRKGGKESLYVGETENLKRRLGNYRNPGQSQQTSLRINASLKRALSEGAEISLSVVLKDAWIDRKGKRQTLDLSSKVIRCLLENLAILDGGGTDIHNLNKANIAKSVTVE